MKDLINQHKQFLFTAITFILNLYIHIYIYIPFPLYLLLGPGVLDLLKEIKANVNNRQLWLSVRIGKQPYL